jgi:adenosylcobinamide-GDP ribazoletransferase
LVIPLGLRMALRHLTVVPIPWDAREAATPPCRALPWFPVVGLGIGCAAALILLLPIPTLPRAALALATWIALSGGLHEDGLMDCADAALPPVPRERRLEILRDPRVGAFAVVAESLMMLLRFSALAVVSPVAVVVAAVSGRWVMTLTLSSWPSARPDGMGARYAKDAPKLSPTVVAIIVLIGVGALFAATSAFAASGATIAHVVAGLAGAGPLTHLAGISAPLVAAGLGLAIALAAASWLSTRFGGLTGDAHGAAGVIAETVVLFAFLPICGVASAC